MRDFSIYQQWIEQLIPFANHKSFDVLFNRIAVKMSLPEAFQLKLEIKRQTKPCQRSVDLRGRIDGDCEAVDIQGVTHYLDAVATDMLQQLMVKFDGVFTEAIFDALQNTPNNHRVMRQQEQQALKNQALKKIGAAGISSDQTNKASRRYVARLKGFYDYKYRRHERMFYVTKVKVKVADIEVEAISLNISMAGICLKLANSKINFQSNTKVSVSFVKLIEQGRLKAPQWVQFELAYSKQYPNYLLCGLRLLAAPDHQDYLQLVESLIREHKLVYKVEVGYVEEAILQRAYEYQSIATASLLPIYYSAQQDQLDLLYSLSNSKTQPILKYFNQPDGNALESILNPKRLKPLFAQQRSIKDCTLYVFKAQDAIYAAFDFELDQQLASVFFACARAQTDFRQFQLKSQPIDGSQYHISSVLDDSFSREIQQRNTSISARTAAKLSQINGLFNLLDISQQQWHFDLGVTGDLAQLDSFKVELAIFYRLQVIPREFIDKRQEPRYEMRSRAYIMDEQTNNETEVKTVDFSIKGLRVESFLPLNLKKGALVRVNLAQVQGMTRIFKLHRLLYQVVEVYGQGRKIGLSAVEDAKSQHVGRLFFRELIKKNQQKLHINDTLEVQELSTGLTNLLVKNQMQTVAFVETKDDQLGFSMLLTNQRKGPLLQLCDIHHTEAGHCIELTKLVSQERMALLQQKINNNVAKNYFELIVISKANGDFDSKIDEDFAHLNQLREYINACQQEGGKVFVLRVVTSALNEYKPDIFNLELKYVYQFAPSRNKAILQQIDSIAGVCHMFEITNAFLARLGL